MRSLVCMCGCVLLCAAGLSHGYNGRTLFKDVDMEIEQGERVAIIGPNGCVLLLPLLCVCTSFAHMCVCG